MLAVAVDVRGRRGAAGPVHAKSRLDLAPRTSCFAVHLFDTAELETICRSCVQPFPVPSLAATLPALLALAVVLPGCVASDSRHAPTADADGDGIANADDPDDDNDGTPDAQDAVPFDARDFLDHDRDGRGDSVDPDDDGDNTPDEGDAFPFNPFEHADADGDGVGDFAQRRQGRDG